MRNSLVILILLSICITQINAQDCSSGALIVNEFGQGSAGSEDWVELLVIKEGTGTVDLNGWIIDDNNNEAATTNVGNANGYLKINTTSCPCLASVPVGARIVVYNQSDRWADIPADDECDANSDLVYVLPGNSSCFDGCSNNDYTTCTPSTVNWSKIALRNTGDAITTATSTGGIFHQLYYGDVDDTEVLGGMNALDIGSASGGKSVSFGCGSYLDVNNYTGQSNSSANPGAANSTTGNDVFIQNVVNGDFDCSDFSSSCTIPLPVELTSFTATANETSVAVNWTTASELNNDFFVVEHSTNGIDFAAIATVSGNGTTSEVSKYAYVHDAAAGVNYYRLQQVDFDGSFEYSDVVSVNVLGDALFAVNPTAVSDNIVIETALSFNGTAKVSIFNIAGQEVLSTAIEATTTLDVTGLNQGQYVVRIESNGALVTKRFVKL